MEDVKYAGFWIRLGAVLIDLMVMGVVLYIPSTVIYGSEYWVGDQFFYGFWDLMFSYVLPLVGTIWFWLRFSGTPGKMVLKLKIVDAGTGNKLTFGQAIGRYFAYILSAIPFFLGYIWVGFDKRKQGWHDKLAGTIVIRNIKNDVDNFE